MTNRFLLFLFLVPCFQSCQWFQASQSDEVFDEERWVIPDVEDREFPAENFQNIELIPLETTDASILNDIKHLEVIGDHLIIQNESHSELGFPTERLLVFDRQGHFVCQLGERGKGPQEYLKIDDFWIDPANQTVWVYDQQKLLQYNLQGELLHSVEIKAFLGNEFVRIGNKWVFYADNHCNNLDCHNLAYVDKDGVLLSTTLFIPSNMRHIHGVGRNRFVSVHPDTARLIGYDDQIYTLTEAGIVHQIRLDHPTEPMVDDAFYTQDFERNMDYVNKGFEAKGVGFINDFKENDHFRYFTVRKDRKSYTLLCDKSSSTTQLFRTINSTILNVPNAINQSTFYRTVTVQQVQEWLQIDPANLSSFDRELLSDFSESITKLSALDNPVVIAFSLESLKK
jgi:hypothetical protein